MADFLTFTATDFARRFSRIKEDVREHGIVRVVSHDRVVGGFLSPKELENYERLKAQEREILKAGEIPQEFLAALDEAVANYDA
ncbi:hypothetical protein [Rhodobacter sp. NSM]|uniref:hypothetical protein n=1 Tax=Rhodobacter sp. NSM TaxID=3457501 RepID=UPI003FD3BF12